jgi:hypothetical protein
VWNQRKADLRREPGRGTVPLVWAHNLTAAREVAWAPDHPKRPQYLREAHPDVGPAVVVNRITGTVGHGALRAALVPAGVRFVGENHVNVIQRDEGLFAAPMDYDAVLDGLRAERATTAVRLITGNTQVSSVELAHLVPILPVQAPPGPRRR